MKNLLFLILGILLSFTSCSSNDGVFDYTIASRTSDCTGVGPQTCLFVKKGAAKDWELFYSSIDGFDYEPGYEYKLKVKEVKSENTPADASSIKYILVKEIEKLKKDSENLPLKETPQIAADQSPIKCTAKVLEIEKETIGRGAAAGKMEVIVVKLEVTKSQSESIKEGAIIYAELIPSPRILPVIDKEYTFEAKSLHPAHAKGIYLLDTTIMDSVN